MKLHRGGRPRRSEQVPGGFPGALLSHMPQSLYPPARPLGIGEVLDLAFLIFKVTLVRCLPYGVFAMIAGQLPNIYDLLRGVGVHRPFGGGDPIWIALYIIGIVLMLVAWSALLLRQRAIVETPIDGGDSRAGRDAATAAVHPRCFAMRRRGGLR